MPVAFSPMELGRDAAPWAPIAGKPGSSCDSPAPCERPRSSTDNSRNPICRSVECFTRVHHQPIRPLTWWNVVHSYPGGSNVEHPCEAKMRPARSDGQGASEKLLTIKRYLRALARLTGRWCNRKALSSL